MGCKVKPSISGEDEKPKPKPFSILYRETGYLTYASSKPMQSTQNMLRRGRLWGCLRPRQPKEYFNHCHSDAGDALWTIRSIMANWKGVGMVIMKKAEMISATRPLMRGPVSETAF